MREIIRFMRSTCVVFLLLCAVALPAALAQQKINTRLGKGISVVAADSSFSLKFGARFQTLYQGDLNLETKDYADNIMIRRARLKFDGFVYHPSVEYKVELAVANSDINGGAIPQSGNTSNIVLDAVVKWNFSDQWSLWFGQTKLPGNRERVISSQALQLVDRSYLNSRFNLDRDAGVQLHYKGRHYNFAGAVTMGEGRNIIRKNNGGYDFTMRVEYLPFGAFMSKGDYFGADLAREETPKLSIGISYDYNDRASRERGQLGDFLNEEKDLETWFADAHFKYRGFSSLVEYAHRISHGGPVVRDESGDFLDSFYTGRGISAQAGYLFPSDFEIAGRVTDVMPQTETQRDRNTQYTIGASRYFSNHSLKVQTDVTLIQLERKNQTLMYRLQVEVAF